MHCTWSYVVWMYVNISNAINVIMVYLRKYSNMHAYITENEICRCLEKIALKTLLKIFGIGWFRGISSFFLDWKMTTICVPKCQFSHDRTWFCVDLKRIQPRNLTLKRHEEWNSAWNSNTMSFSENFERENMFECTNDERTHAKTNMGAWCENECVLQTFLKNCNLIEFLLM